MVEKSVADFDEILRKEIKFPNSQDVLESSHKTSAKTYSNFSRLSRMMLPYPPKYSQTVRKVDTSLWPDMLLLEHTAADHQF
ncbi:hypothetical protein TB2_034217 [Malus domestica]